MIDTAPNCFRQAAISRAAAQGPMLDNVRGKHLVSAAAWENLGATLLGPEKQGGPINEGALMTKQPSRLDKFRKTALELEADASEACWEDRLKKVAKLKPKVPSRNHD